MIAELMWKTQRMLATLGIESHVYGSYAYGMTDVTDIDIAVSGEDYNRISAHNDFEYMMAEQGFFEDTGELDYCQSIAIVKKFKNDSKPPVQIIVFRPEWFQKILIANNLMKKISVGGPLTFDTASKLKILIPYKEMRHALFALVEEAICEYEKNNPVLN